MVGQQSHVVRTVAWATLANLVLLFVVLVPTGLGTIGQWLVAVGVGAALVGAVSGWQETHISRKERELRGLQRSIRGHQHRWFTLQMHWMGRQVRVTKDFWLDDWDEEEFTIPAGYVGQIVGLNDNAERPFVVRFPGVSERVLIDPHVLEIDPIERGSDAVTESA